MKVVFYAAGIQTMVRLFWVWRLIFILTKFRHKLRDRLSERFAVEQHQYVNFLLSAGIDNMTEKSPASMAHTEQQTLQPVANANETVVRILRHAQLRHHDAT